MAVMKILKNPMKPFNVETITVGNGKTVRACLKEVYTESFKEFSVPTIVVHNGRSLMRSEWDTVVVKEGDVIGITTLPAEPITIILAVVAVVSLGVSLYAMSQVKNMSQFDAPAPDPTYNLSGQKNDFRLMEPIEVNYGRNRVWCTYASKPFNRYIGNDQWLYQLLCIGQGDYDIHQVFIEDTTISSYSDIQYQVIRPNEKVTLIKTNVETSSEVRDIELFGPNEEDYSVVGPFTAVSPLKRTKQLEIDVTLPNGLYYTGDRGLDNRTASAEWEYRAIDDTDQPLGDWQTLVTWTQTLATTTPQRYTLTCEVPEGRYQVRGRRTNNKDTSYRAGNIVKWEAVRAVYEDQTIYGDVTLLAVQAKASNNLNNDSAARINVDCTRKLKTHSNGNWSDRVATRSIVWAFYDVLTNPIYGAGLTDEYIDLVEMERLDSELASEGRYFNGQFKSKSTIWDTLTAIARVARAVPTINGTMLTMVRDKPRSIPQGVFTMDNIIDGSFEWEMSMYDPTESDSVEVTYIDPITFLKESINCRVVDSDGYNPTKIDLVGCTDRDLAYREGMYVAMTKIYNREKISFKTGLEGILPMYGDLIVVQYPLPSFGQASVLSELYENLLVVEDDLEWSVDQQHYALIRGDDGKGYGPFPVSRGTSDSVMVLDSPLELDIGLDNREPPIVVFGGSTDFMRQCVVTSINPEGGEAVTIECTNYDPIVFTHDQDIAPPLDIGDVSALPDIPTVRSLTVIKVPELPDYISVTWPPALGANSYVLEQSNDGVNWSTVVNTANTSWNMQVFKGMLYLRVAGIGAGRGPWVQWSGEVGDYMGVPQSVGDIRTIQDFRGLGFSVDWDNVLTAERYIVDVFEGMGNTLARRVSVVVPSFTYNYEMAQTDDKVARQYLLRVYAVNSFGESGSSSTILSNPVPNPPIDLNYALNQSEDTYKVYRITWANPNPPSDLAGYKVYASSTTGFTPNESNKVFDGISLGVSHVINLDTNGKHPAQYIRVGTYDVWGDEVSLSGEMTIPAVV